LPVGELAEALAERRDSVGLMLGNQMPFGFGAGPFGLVGDASLLGEDPGRIGLGSQPDVFDRRILEGLDSRGHCANLVLAAGERHVEREIATSKAAHRPFHLVERPDHAAQHREGAVADGGQRQAREDGHGQRHVGGDLLASMELFVRDPHLEVDKVTELGNHRVDSRVEPGPGETDDGRLVPTLEDGLEPDKLGLRRRHSHLGLIGDARLLRCQVI